MCSAAFSMKEVWFPQVCCVMGAFLRLCTDSGHDRPYPLVDSNTTVFLMKCHLNFDFQIPSVWGDVREVHNHPRDIPMWGVRRTLRAGGRNCRNNHCILEAQSDLRQPNKKHASQNKHCIGGRGTAHELENRGRRCVSLAHHYYVTNEPPNSDAQ